jgi:hypothetical protein
LFVAFAAMVRDLADPDLCLFFTTTILLLKHIITPKEAFAGFGNDSIVTIAIMMVLAAGLEAVGAVQIVARFMLGKSRAVWFLQVRLLVHGPLCLIFTCARAPCRLVLAVRQVDASSKKHAPRRLRLQPSIHACPIP